MCERFLKHLRHAVEDRLRTALPGIEDDFHVKCRYGQQKKNASALWITRDAWAPYDDPRPNHDGRNTIRFQSEGGAGTAGIGVSPARSLGAG